MGAASFGTDLGLSVDLKLIFVIKTTSNDSDTVQSGKAV